MFSASRKPKLGHSDLLSGGEEDLAHRHINAKLECSSSNGYDLCTINYLINQVVLGGLN